MLAHPAKLRLINTDLNTANGVSDQNEPAGSYLYLVESQQHIINPTNLGGALDIASSTG